MTTPVPPFTVVELPGCFRVDDGAGRAVAYVYFAEGARHTAMPDLWSRDEARVIAERIARGFSAAMKAGERGGAAGSVGLA